jgi:hypothetical protein
LTNSSGTVETQAGTEFILNVAAGLLPSINVTGPGATTAGFFTVYAGLFSGAETRQSSSLSATATGAVFTFAFPLTNYAGINRAVTTPTANIVGLAIQDAALLYAANPGGSLNAGSPSYRIGVWGNPKPLAPGDPLQPLIASLEGNAPVEICLKQAWSDTLIGKAVGLTLDTNSGWFVADTSVTTIGTIVEKVTGASAPGPYDDVGGPGDTNARVKIVLTSGVI